MYNISCERVSMEGYGKDECGRKAKFEQWLNHVIYRQKNEAGQKRHQKENMPNECCVQYVCNWVISINSMLFLLLTSKYWIFSPYFWYLLRSHWLICFYFGFFLFEVCKSMTQNYESSATQSLTSSYYYWAICRIMFSTNLLSLKWLQNYCWLKII